MTSRTSSAAISFVALLAFSSALSAQRPKTPTLGEILDRLEANLNYYDARLPSLFCDEHVVSSQVEPGMRDLNTTTDSVFRLKRVPRPDHTVSLTESREIQYVDGKPATSQPNYDPTMLSGAFEGGLAVVSRNQTPCTSYALQTTHREQLSEPYIVRFATALTSQNSADCLLQENSSGRAFIDPASLQITHLELTTPHHLIIPGTPFISPIKGKRVLSIDYAPVELGGETFWMPSTITMRNVGGSGTFHMMVWSYKATYRNYHLLEVTSRILPGSKAPAP
ncbi:MAG: hypothetical protein ABSD59_22145 [Terracidiphilus sp.]|jgi:hypothetical protein